MIEYRWIDGTINKMTKVKEKYNIIKIIQIRVKKGQEEGG